MAPRWTKWTDSRDAAQFTDARAAENADYLRAVLGEWVANDSKGPGGHPLQSHWTWGGPSSFLALNALAEDMRLLQDVPGFEATLHDLKQEAGYEPTRHALRSAALFARGGARVARLFEPSNESIPDFEVELGDTMVPVEAKQLTDSEPSKRFRVYSNELEKHLLKAILPDKRKYPDLQIIIKDIEAVPPVEVVSDAVRAALRAFVGFTFVKRFPELNIRVEPNAQARAFSEYRSLQILCPRSPKESPRVARRAEKSNKQLRNWSRDLVPGVLCLGLTQHQDPHLVAEVLRKKFAGGQLRGISGVLLHAPAEHHGPGVRCVVDMLSTVRNLKALIPLPENLPLRAIGLSPNLFAETRPPGAVSVYQRASLRFGKALEPPRGFVGLKMVSGLPPGLLA